MSIADLISHTAHGVYSALLEELLIRTRQAMQVSDKTFGGLLSVLSNDFLQLPPVRKLTLATKLDDAGFSTKWICVL